MVRRLLAEPAFESANTLLRDDGRFQWYLVVGALDLFAEQGFEATSVEQIAKAAGVSRSTFFRQFGGTELRLKLVWLCWLDLMTGNSLDDWTKTLKHKSEKDLEQWIIPRQGQSEPLTNLMDQYVLMAYRTSVDAAHS